MLLQASFVRRALTNFRLHFVAPRRISEHTLLRNCQFPCGVRASRGHGHRSRCPTGNTGRAELPFVTQRKAFCAKSGIAPNGYLLGCNAAAHRRSALPPSHVSQPQLKNNYVMFRSHVLKMNELTNIYTFFTRVFPKEREALFAEQGNTRSCGLLSSAHLSNAVPRSGMSGGRVRFCRTHSQRVLRCAHQQRRFQLLGRDFGRLRHVCTSPGRHQSLRACTFHPVRSRIPPTIIPVLIILLRVISHAFVISCGIYSGDIRSECSLLIRY